MNTTLKTIIAATTLGLSFTTLQATTPHTTPCDGGGCCGENTETTTKSSDNKEVKVWTCSMHPEIKSAKPGKCPKCGMKLIPAKKQDSKKSARHINSTPFHHYHKQMLACGGGGHGSHGNGGRSHGDEHGNGHNHTSLNAHV